MTRDIKALIEKEERTKRECDANPRPRFTGVFEPLALKKLDDVRLMRFIDVNAARMIREGFSDTQIVTALYEYQKSAAENPLSPDFPMLRRVETIRSFSQDNTRVLSADLPDLPDPNEWMDLFDSRETLENSPPLSFAIEGWMPCDGITMYGALPGHGKTWLGIATAKALLTGKPLFGHREFKVNNPSERVLYLCPEVGRGPLMHRLRKFGLEGFIDEQLFVRTMQSYPNVELTDPRILTAAKGADVFLDTAVRFMEGEENSASEQRVFSRNLFALVSAGARTVTGLHHAPKNFESAQFMTMENCFRGSSELTAMLSMAWGVRRVSEGDDRNHTTLYVQNLKIRDGEPRGSFIIEGRPHIDREGDFRVVAEPGTAGEMRNHLGPRNPGGRPASWAGHEDEIRQGLLKGLSFQKVGEAVGVSWQSVRRFAMKEGLALDRLNRETDKRSE